MSGKGVETLKQAYKSPWFISAVIAVITLLVFWRVLIADFVMWDDDWCIYKNTTLGGLTLENLRLLFTNDIISSTWYTPLTGLRWCITYQFCQLNPLGYHLGNLLLHAADAVLVFWVLRKLLILGLFRNHGGIPPQINVYAALGALLWSLHPMRVEVVSWAAQAYGQALLFLLISLLSYLRANDAKTTRKRWLLLTVSLILFAASLLTQPLGIGFLAVLVVLDVYPLGRLGGGSGWWKSANARSALFEKIPFIGVAAAVLLMDVIMEARSPTGGHRLVSLAEFGVFQRFMQAMYVWTYYIWRPWYPFNLSPVYTTLVSFDPLSLPFIISAASVIGVITILVLFRRRWPLGLALGACYLALLVPVLGISEHPHFTCDRYSLAVSIVWSVLLAAWLADPKTKTLFRNSVLVLSIIVIASLGFLSFRQTHIWNNSVSLFEYMLRTLGDDPYTWDIHFRYGKYLDKHDQTDKAIEHLKQSVKINPSLSDQRLAVVHDYLAQILLRKGQVDEAIVQYRDAIRIKPDQVTSVNALAWFLAVKKDSKFHDPAEAILLAQCACRLTKNEEPAVLDTLATAYAANGQFNEAVNTAQKAIDLARSLQQNQLADEIEKHLNLYKAGQPYVETLP